MLGTADLNPLWSDDVERRIRDAAYNMDRQETPKDVVFCKRCVISNQRPRIVFDEDGICSACRFAEAKSEIDWDARNLELAELLQEHRGKRTHDVIVPCSGGKDSATIAHRLKHHHQMNPLCVKWAPHLYTEIGFRNFNAAVQSGLDFQVGWPNGLVHRKLSRLALEFVGDHFLPFIYGQLYYPLHIAAQTGVQLVMMGENGEAEYGGDPSANFKPRWSSEDWDRIYMKGTKIDDLIKIGLDLGALTKTEAEQISPFYYPPKQERLVGVECHWFSYYRKWHPQENYYYAAQHTGFQANPEGRSVGTYSKYASLDDATDDFHYFLGYMKFGLGRATSDAAHEIRDGEIDREEALALVKKYDGEYPERNMDIFCRYLGIDDQWFREICHRFQPPHLWYGNKGWNIGGLNHRVYDVEETPDSETGHQGAEPYQASQDGGA